MGFLKRTTIILILLAVYVSPLWASGPFPNVKLRKQQIRKVNPTVVYVNHASQAEAPDGSSWISAYPTLSDALNSDLTGKKEIWVATGKYYPTMGTDRTASFTLIPGISLFGGFQGTEVLRAQRNWTKSPTILSGEINDPTELSDNVYHVVTGSDDAVIDGFTIQDGYAVLKAGETDDSGTLVDTPDGASDMEILRIVTHMKSSAGGGLLNLHAGTLTRNCVFQNNHAVKGGAVYNMVTRFWDPDNKDATIGGDTPYFQNCIFDNNHAIGRGGAVNNDFMTSSTFVNCIFSNNSCEAKGGALYADMGSPVYLLNVLFGHNEAERGAALAADGSSPHRMVYTTFVQNMAYDLGAALYQGTYMAQQVDGTSFVGNEVHLYRSVVLSNISISSPSSISNWNDSRVTADNESVVEYTDGTLAIAEYIDVKNGFSKSQNFGFYPNRKMDIAYWIDTFDNDENRLYTADTYDTKSLTGTPGIMYVAADAAPGGDGTSWSTAFTDLNQALEQAVSGSQIWMAQGSYLPTDGTDRSATFVMKEGVSIYGGFNGTESRVDQRNWEKNPTILSGDIGQTGDDSDNSYHVLFGASDSVLDGFIIQGGHADGDFHHTRGGGLLCEAGASPRIVNCVFKNNAAMEGGGIACNDHAAPIIENCTISANTARSGAGILFRTGPDTEALGARITDSDFLDNVAQDRGGAAYIDYGAWPTFTGCRISGNTSMGNGAGVYVDNNASQLSRIEARFNSCQFTENTSSLRGGAFAVYEGMVFLNDSTITGNSAVTGGGGIALDYMGEYTNVDLSSVIENNATNSGEGDIDNASLELDFGSEPPEGL